MVISGNNSLDNEIRNMTYTNTAGQNSQDALLTDMSPFGGNTTHGRESYDNNQNQTSFKQLVNNSDA